MQWTSIYLLNSEYNIVVICCRRVTTQFLECEQRFSIILSPSNAVSKHFPSKFYHLAVIFTCFWLFRVQCLFPICIILLTYFFKAKLIFYIFSMDAKVDLFTIYFSSFQVQNWMAAINKPFYTSTLGLCWDRKSKFGFRNSNVDIWDVMKFFPILFLSFQNNEEREKTTNE